MRLRRRHRQGGQARGRRSLCFREPRPYGVEITLGTAGAVELGDAISEAGFTPVLMPSGFTLPGLGRTLQNLPFEGPDHDFNIGTIH